MTSIFVIGNDQPTRADDTDTEVIARLTSAAFTGGPRTTLTGWQTDAANGGTPIAPIFQGNGNRYGITTNNELTAGSAPGWVRTNFDYTSIENIEVGITFLQGFAASGTVTIGEIFLGANAVSASAGSTMASMRQVNGQAQVQLRINDSGMTWNQGASGMYHDIQPGDRIAIRQWGNMVSLVINETTVQTTTHPNPHAGYVGWFIGDNVDTVWRFDDFYVDQLNAPSASSTLVLWEEDFDTSLSLTHQTEPGVFEPGTFRSRGADDNGNPNYGYDDYAGLSYNISPHQFPDHTPFSIDDSKLRITAKRTPQQIVDANVTDLAWAGGYLVTEPLSDLSWSYGYYEWENVSVPVTGRGMFPALWLYTNHLPGSAVADKSGAEMNALEIFGWSDGATINSNYHLRPVPGTESSFPSRAIDWSTPHTFGIEWSEHAIRFYVDDQLTYWAPQSAVDWFRDFAEQGGKMGMRVNYAMDPSWLAEGHAQRSTASDPAPSTELYMEVDALRVYDHRPSAYNQLAVEPSQVLSLSAIPGDQQSSLSWSEPVDTGGSPVTDYLVEYKLTSDSAWLVFDDGSTAATTAIVTGLTNGVSYDFRVSAINAVGAGTASAPATALFVIAPSAPLSLTPARTDSAVSLTWAAPTSDGGAPVADYIVQYKETSHSTWLTLADGVGITTAATVTDLTNGVSYDFRVAAVNEAGTGTYSSIVTAVPATVPAAPIVSTTTGPTSVTLSWATPDNGGEAITDYIVEMKLSGADTYTVYSDDSSTSTSVTIADLVVLTSYDFRVTAVNIIGNSTPSVVVTATTDEIANSIHYDTHALAHGAIVDRRPTFSGTANPGSMITVTAGSITDCTTTADGNGNWSCTLSDDLTAGDHSIVVTIVPFGGTEADAIELGPYTVTVATDAAIDEVEIAPVLAPNTGLASGSLVPYLVALGVGGALLLGTVFGSRIVQRIHNRE